MVEIPIVNEKDEIIRYKERDFLDDKDVYRVAILWVKNSKGKILLAQRSFAKKKSPGVWGPAAAGTVEKGDGYKENIVKEAREELGIILEEYKLGRKIRVSHKYNYFAQWFFAVIDKKIGEFRFNSEVETIRWIFKGELIKEVRKNPLNFTPAINDYFNFGEKDST